MAYYYIEIELTESEHKSILEYCDDHGIIFNEALCTWIINGLKDWECKKILEASDEI